MKKIVTLMMLLCFAVCAHASPGISFANGTNGYWNYTASGTTAEGAFSFVQPVNVTNVVGGSADILLGKEVYVPALNVGGLTEVYTNVYQGTVSTSAVIEIKDGGTVVLTGNLASGAVFTVGTTASFYDTIDFDDIEITSLNVAYNASAFIGSLVVGDTLDFALTLQRAGSTTTIAEMILDNDSTDDSTNSSRSFSGSMAVPEPATMVLLGLGGLLLRRRK